MAPKTDKTGADKSNRNKSQQAGMEASSAIDLLEEDRAAKRVAVTRP